MLLFKAVAHQARGNAGASESASLCARFPSARYRRCVTSRGLASGDGDCGAARIIVAERIAPRSDHVGGVNNPPATPEFTCATRVIVAVAFVSKRNPRERSLKSFLRYRYTAPSAK